MDSDMAFLKNLEAFLDSSLINVASTESPFDTDDASLLLGTAESVNLSSALETDPMTARTLPGLIASITKPAVAPVIKSVRIQKMPFEQRRPSADKYIASDHEKADRQRAVIRKTTRSQPPDSSLCAAFLQDLEVNYTQTDKVFEDTNFVSNSQGSWQSAHKDRSDDSMKHFIRSTKMLYPITFASACQEMWSYAKQRTHADEVQVYNGGKDVRNTIAVRYRISKLNRLGKLRQSTVLALRRFVGVDNMVFVWKVLAEGEGFLRGIRADETGWCRVRPPTNPAEPGAWIELYARRTILHYTEGQLDAHTVGLFNDVLQCNLGEEQDEERAEGL
ncbi:hypothetical protein GQ600_14478 [Phytophthora cactorum]|nr:hypothetical protein GQ600_14478 [Phytophthora cactorum]